MLKRPPQRGLNIPDQDVPFGGRVREFRPSCVLGTNLADATVGAGVTSHVHLLGGGSSATEAIVQMAMPYAGEMSRLYLITGGAQPGTGSLVATVRVNGASAQLTRTLAAGSAAGTYSDLTHRVRVKQGDLVSLQVLNNAAAASAPLRSITLRLEQA